MKISIATIIGLAGQAAQLIENTKHTIDEFRAIVKRESPADLEAFDAAVASARKPWTEAAAAAVAEEAGGK